jgi:hypothetical protein
MDRKEPQATSSHVPISPVLALPPPPVGPLPLDPGSLDPTAGSSAAAIARSAASSMAFIFKRPPLRFFRPVKSLFHSPLSSKILTDITHCFPGILTRIGVFFFFSFFLRRASFYLRGSTSYG